jgi:uncharacterized protein YbaP (TraB family)
MQGLTYKEVFMTHFSRVALQVVTSILGLAGLQAAHAQTASPAVPSPQEIAAAIDAAPPRGPLYTPLVGAQALVLEANLTDTEEMQTAFARYAQEPAGQPNWQALPKALREKALGTARELKVPEAALLKQRPWMAALTLSIADIARTGYTPDAGTETFLTAVITPRGTPIVALEGFGAQLALFDGMHDKLKYEFVEQALADIASGKSSQTTAELVRAWESGQLGLLEAALLAEYDHNSAADRFFMEELITKRNRAMAEKIDQLAADNRLFVGVGALHLAGKQGLVELLRAKGYTVKPAPRGLEAKPKAR